MFWSTPDQRWAVTYLWVSSSLSPPNKTHGWIIPQQLLPPTCANEGSFLLPSSNDQWMLRGYALLLLYLWWFCSSGDTRIGPKPASPLLDLVFAAIFWFSRNLPGKCWAFSRQRQHKSGAQTQIKTILKELSQSFLTTPTDRVNWKSTIRADDKEETCLEGKNKLPDICGKAGVLRQNYWRTGSTQPGSSSDRRKLPWLSS